jgi:hypothetical protein
MGNTHAATLAFLFLLLLLFAGCGSKKLTQENYDKIEIGMTQKEVIAILGQGELAGAGVISDGGRFVELRWSDEEMRSITMTFVEDKEGPPGGELTEKSCSGL